MKHQIRPIPLAGAFVTLGAVILLAAQAHAGWWVIPAGVVGPDLAFLAAIGAPATQPGLMPARAVGPYNLLHHPAGPIAAAALSSILGNPSAIALSLTWGSHVLWDRGVGYGLRGPDGSIIPTQPHPRRTTGSRLQNLRRDKAPVDQPQPVKACRVPPAAS